MKKIFVIHPFLFALSPILFLYSYNISQVPFNHILLPSAIILIVTILLLILSRLFFKGKGKSEIVVSVFLIMFFSFDRIAKIAYYLAIFKHEEYMVLILNVLFIIYSVFFIKKVRDTGNITKIFNVIAITIVMLSLIKITNYKINSQIFLADNEDIKFEQENLKEGTELPSIYYIILDGHARQDVLKEVFQYDNGSFINYLIEKGFYVAHKSNANYVQSIISLPSSLNLQYFDDLAKTVGVESNDCWPLLIKWRYNRVFSFLKKYGYKIVTFDARGLNIYLTKNDVDIFYSTPGVGTVNGFQSELFNSTPIPFIAIKLFKIEDIRYAFHRKKILNAFDRLVDISKQNNHFFVFAHLLTPHQPFVFGENGEKVTPEWDCYTEWYTMSDGRDREKYIESYKKQVHFIDKKMQEIIDEIISNSSVPPIIILQSDHGSAANLDPEDAENTDHKERLGILNAYYFPDRDYSELYESISPVNSFRVVLNHFFDGHFELLKDKNYFSTWSRPYKFIDVTDKVK